MKTVNNSVFIKYSLVVAINSKGVVGWKLYEKGGMSGVRMVSFLEVCIQVKQNLILMDNAGCP